MGHLFDHPLIRNMQWLQAVCNWFSTAIEVGNHVWIETNAVYETTDDINMRVRDEDLQHSKRDLDRSKTSEKVCREQGSII